MNTTQLSKNQQARICSDVVRVIRDVTLFSKLCSLEQMFDADTCADWYEYDATIRQIFNETNNKAFTLIATRREPFGFTCIHLSTGVAVAFYIKHNKYDLIFSYNII